MYEGRARCYLHLPDYVRWGVEAEHRRLSSEHKYHDGDYEVAQDGKGRKECSGVQDKESDNGGKDDHRGTGDRRKKKKPPAAEHSTPEPSDDSSESSSDDGRGPGGGDTPAVEMIARHQMTVIATRARQMAMTRVGRHGNGGPKTLQPRSAHRRQRRRYSRSSLREPKLSGR